MQPKTRGKIKQLKQLSGNQQKAGKSSRYGKHPPDHPLRSSSNGKQPVKVVAIRKQPQESPQNAAKSSINGKQPQSIPCEASAFSN
jgi:hypothetical protein